MFPCARNVNECVSTHHLSHRQIQVPHIRNMGGTVANMPMTLCDFHYVDTTIIAILPVLLLLSLLLQAWTHLASKRNKIVERVHVRGPAGRTECKFGRRASAQVRTCANLHCVDIFKCAVQLYKSASVQMLKWATRCALQLHSTWTKLPSAGLHLNASRQESVLVKQAFTPFWRRQMIF